METNKNNILKTLRIKQGLTQREVAVKLGVSQQTYSHYETGIQPVPLYRINELATILNVDTDILLNEFKREGDIIFTKYPPLLTLDYKIMKLIKDLDEETKEKIYYILSRIHEINKKEK